MIPRRSAEPTLRWRISLRSSALRLLATGVAIAAAIGTMTGYPASASIQCPSSYKGKPLKDVALFDGPPSERVELMPQVGRFVVPLRPQGQPTNFTPGCTYRGSDEMVTVVLPRSVRVCDFPNYPKVNCH